MSAALIARPYARAAFAFAGDSGAVDEWRRMLAALADLARHPDFVFLLSDPRAPREAALAVATEALAAFSADSHFRNFLALLARYRRFHLAGEIAAQFESFWRARAGEVEVEIASAYPLPDGALAEIAAALGGRLGEAKILPRPVVEPSLIGGARIRIGDDVIDASVRGGLRRLAAALG